MQDKGIREQDKGDRSLTRHNRDIDQDNGRWKRSFKRELCASFHGN